MRQRQALEADCRRRTHTYRYTQTRADAYVRCVDKPLVAWTPDRSRNSASWGQVVGEVEGSSSLKVVNLYEDLRSMNVSDVRVESTADNDVAPEAPSMLCLCVCVRARACAYVRTSCVRI